MNWLRSLFKLPVDGEVIRRVDPPLDGFGVQADAEQIELTRQRQQQARDAMGTKWIGHHRHAAKVSQSRLLRDWDEAITEDRLRSAPRSIVNFHRRFK